MIGANKTSKARIRTLLVLGRVSNLPTVWSNCLAGWILAGGGEWWRFGLVCLGATFLYLGGMYLNDAFDGQYDRQHRRERPIPAGAISAWAVWQWGFTWLLLGLASLIILGKTAAVLAWVLVLLIFLYNAIHKIFAFSPLLMGACRGLLVLLAASTALEGINGLAIWSALVLASYTMGVTFLARRETMRAPLQRWPCIFLVAPVVLAVVVNPPGEYLARGILLSLLLMIWVVRWLWVAYWSEQRNVGRSVAGLLAGIVLVDWLAIAPSALIDSAPFLALFALSILLQRFIPST